MSLRLLLISNSTCHGRGYLDHCAEEIGEFLGDRRRLAFVPFALFDQEGYGRIVETRLAGLGIETTTVTPDEQGLRGAQSLAAALLPVAQAVRVIQPPQGVKDARAWALGGGTSTDVQAAIDMASIRRFSIREVRYG